jgi:hypothetical protein
MKKEGCSTWPLFFGKRLLPDVAKTGHGRGTIDPQTARFGNTSSGDLQAMFCR